MARMYPERLPESVLRDPKRSAERRVYQALSRLGDKFLVFYSVAWQARRRDAGAQDGEADFVIAHADLGILVMEVKGGGISYNACTKQWSSTDRDGEIHSIDDPVEQARRSRYALFGKLCDMRDWNQERWLTIGQVVAFPDVHVGTVSLRPDLPREIILDADDVHHIQDAVLRSFKHYSAEDGRAGGLGQDRLGLVERLLARSFQLRTPLGVELEYEDERLIDLTERQMMVLDFLSNRRRAAITGCAGSGKTMLAIEKARRLAIEGFEVLLTCHSKPLAEDLHHRMSDKIPVMHFHGLCSTMAREAGIATGDVDSLPDALLEAVDRLGPRFDAIIVDEGQDFEETWWLPLVSLLRDPEDGILYVFFDDNQNIYRRQGHIPGVVDELPFTLTDNCRNTQRIHQVVSSFYHAPTNLRCQGPPGRQVETLSYRGESQLIRMVGRQLHRLVEEERIGAGNIVLLTLRSQDRSALKAGTRVGKFVLTTDAPSSSSHIQVSTVHSFKGREKQVVMLAEIDRFASSDLGKVLYVGCSRARTHLLLLMDTDAPHAVKERVRQATM